MEHEGKLTVPFPAKGSLDIIFLGTGVSSCVPNIACIMRNQYNDKGVCESARNINSRNRRNNVSILIRFHDKDGKERAVQVDCGKTFRDGAVRFYPKFNIKALDALILTHEHADAVLGLDDLRDVQKCDFVYEADGTHQYKLEKSFPVYCTPTTEATLQKVFPYLCKPVSKGGVETLSSSKGFKPSLEIKELISKVHIASVQLYLLENATGEGRDEFIINGLHVCAFSVIHGYPNQECLAFIFNHNIVYISDVKVVPKGIFNWLLEKKDCIELLILDCIFHEEHNTHFNWEDSLKFISQLQPKKALLVGMSCMIGDHDEVNMKLEERRIADQHNNKITESIELSYDGLKLPSFPMEMGVKNLWTLLQAAGRNISIESLDGKSLAVDASIWIIQFVKAARGPDGNMIHNAHLSGIFSRVLKLMFYKLKVVFVFDGGAPVLKKRELTKRRQTYKHNESKLKQAARKLLAIQMLKSSIKGTTSGKNKTKKGGVSTSKVSFASGFITSSQAEKIIEEGQQKERIKRGETKEAAIEVEEEEGGSAPSWICQSCTFINKGMDIYCKVCNTVDENAEDEDWVCDHCGCYNTVFKNKVCKVCSPEVILSGSIDVNARFDRDPDKEYQIPKEYCEALRNGGNGGGESKEEGQRLGGQSGGISNLIAQHSNNDAEDKSEVVYEDWSCDTCTFNNTATNKKCEVCDSDNPFLIRMPKKSKLSAIIEEGGEGEGDYDDNDIEYEEEDGDEEWERLRRRAWKKSQVSLSLTKLLAQKNTEMQKLESINDYDLQWEMMEYIRRIQRSKNRNSYFTSASTPESFSLLQLKNYRTTASINKSLSDIRTRSGGGESDEKRIASDANMTFVFRETKQQVKEVIHDPAALEALEKQSHKTLNFRNAKGEMVNFNSFIQGSRDNMREENSKTNEKEEGKGKGMEEEEMGDEVESKESKEEDKKKCISIFQQVVEKQGKKEVEECKEEEDEEEKEERERERKRNQIYNINDDEEEGSGDDMRIGVYDNSDDGGGGGFFPEEEEEEKKEDDEENNGKKEREREKGKEEIIYNQEMDKEKVSEREIEIDNKMEERDRIVIEQEEEGENEIKAKKIGNRKREVIVIEDEEEWGNNDDEEEESDWKEITVNHKTTTSTFSPSPFISGESKENNKELEGDDMIVDDDEEWPEEGYEQHKEGGADGQGEWKELVLVAVNEESVSSEQRHNWEVVQSKLSIEDEVRRIEKQIQIQEEEEEKEEERRRRMFEEVEEEEKGGEGEEEDKSRRGEESFPLSVFSETDRQESDKNESDNNNVSYDDLHPSLPSQAIQDALLTADNLTSWAGNTFRKALREAGIENPQKPQQQQQQQNNNNKNEGKEESVEIVEKEKDKDQGKEKEKEKESSESKEDESRRTANITELEDLDIEEHDLAKTIRNANRDTDNYTGEMLEDVKVLLEILGVPYIVAPGEAEAQCATLELLGLVDGTITQDCDAFLFGAKKVYRNFFRPLEVQEFRSKDINNELSFDRETLICLALLLGSDYTNGVHGIGIVNAAEIVSVFPGYEGLRAFREWVEEVLPDKEKDAHDNEELKTFKKKHSKSKKKWLLEEDFPSLAVIQAYEHPNVDSTNEIFTFGRPERERLYEFCAAKLNWSKEKVDAELDPALRNFDSTTNQRTLHNYFNYENNNIAGVIQSKRLKKALEASKRVKIGETEERTKQGKKRSLDKGKEGKKKNKNKKRKMTRVVESSSSEEEYDKREEEESKEERERKEEEMEEEEEEEREAVQESEEEVDVDMTAVTNNEEEDEDNDSFVQNSSP